MMRCRNVTAAAQTVAKTITKTSIGTLIGAAFWLCTTTAHSTAYGADLPNDVRLSSSAPDAKQIDTYIGDQLQRVASNDPKISATARDEINRQVAPDKTSPTFRIAFVSSLKTQIKPLLTSKKIVDRLNAGIIIARVAAASEDGRLQDEAIVLMNDPSPAIALWGVKTTRAILPSVFGAAMMRQGEKLTPNLIKTVKAHASTGAIVQEAYAALDLSLTQPPAIKAASAATIDLLEARIDGYVKGIPAVPHAERGPLNYFGRGPIFAQLTPADKVRVVQDFVNLMAVSANRAKDQGGATREALLDVASNAAGGLIVQLQQNAVNSASVTTISGALKFVINNRSLLPADVDTRVNAAIASIKAVPQFAALKDPPAIKPLPESATANGG